MRYVFLNVQDGRSVPLGGVDEPEDLPQLLRRAADFYDGNRGECAALLSTLSVRSGPAYVTAPFGGHSFTSAA